MDTIPEPFNLCNAPMGKPPGRGGVRVPFGLRDGRVWAPSEVAKGKTCGCICPGCGVPLAAKAQASRRRRAHFAHLAETACQTGPETGIHLRAKQLIAERLELLIPAWLGDLVDMPNPPHARDDEGRLHWGRKVDHPPQRSELRDVEFERSFGTYQPDVYALDEIGELLIEIRVTHAVDDRKAARVQARGHRMVEIDLSRLDRDTPHNLAAFEHAVLFEATNRNWISCPQAVADWQAAKLELDAQVAARNAEIHRKLLARSAQARLERSLVAASVNKLTTKSISDTYHLCETGVGWSRVRALRTAALKWGWRMIPPKADVLTCILVVAATLLVGIARCTRCTSRFP